MEMKLSTSEREELRKLQKNLCGSSDYARVTCLLMLDKGHTPSAVSGCLGIDAALKKHPDAPVIYIISDNARYYHNRDLREWAEGRK
ncbi:MAG: hypothetical protein J6C86_04095 [Bacteroidaceae bacterium]|nr:hypothetical protein [Bacteroidaceae bacterium]